MPPLPPQTYASSIRLPPELRDIIDAFLSTALNHRARQTHLLSPFIPTPTTLHLPPGVHALHRRESPQNLFFALPASYNTSGPSPGTVVGITLGSVGGFLLLVWLFTALANSTGGGYYEGDDDEVVMATSRRSERSRRTRPRRPPRSEKPPASSVSGSPAPAPQPRRERTERIIVEETRRTERSAAAPRAREVSRERESVVVEETRERRVEGDDVVEVIEEEESVFSEERPAPRRKKRESGYRTVDPGQYAGGNYAQREVHESRRGPSRR